MLPSAATHRLSADGQHAFIDANGAFIGLGVPLLEKDASGRWRPRAQAELERLLRVGHGKHVDLGWRMAKLAAVARALDARDQSMAAIALVQAEFPALPDLAAALRMVKADGIAKYNPHVDVESRVPAGSGIGSGEWTTGGAGGTAPDGIVSGHRIVSTSTESAMPSQAVHATANGNRVVIEYVDGTMEERTGGSRTWRDNNPCAIEYGRFAREQGAIGTDGLLAIFPDEESGERAAQALLTSPNIRP